MEKGIHANIDINSRNNKNEPQTKEYQYFDEELYKRRTLIEHVITWMDSFRALLIRFETKIANWAVFTLIAFSVRCLRKIQTKT